MGEKRGGGAPRCTGTLIDAKERAGRTSSEREDRGGRCKGSEPARMRKVHVLRVKMERAHTQKRTRTHNYYSHPRQASNHDGFAVGIQDDVFARVTAQQDAAPAHRRGSARVGLDGEMLPHLSVGFFGLVVLPRVCLCAICYSSLSLVVDDKTTTFTKKTMQVPTGT